MVAPGIAGLPWKEIIKALPALVDAATRLWRKTASQPQTIPIKPDDEPKAQFAAVVARLESLESSEAAQAELIKELLQQLQGISMGLSEVSRRARSALVLSLGALSLSAIGWIVVLTR